MDSDEILLDAEDRMDKAVKVLGDKYRGMRTGRANPGLIESIRVDYYGATTPLKQLANISAPEPDLLVIKPFDANAMSEIQKAIQKSDIGIPPSSDGRLIRLQVPPLSEERRDQLVSLAKKVAEESRVAIRNVRRDANKDAEKLQKDKEISEDDLKQLKEDIQDLVKAYEKKVDVSLKEKSADLTDF
jgi:ribosome recycling factor